MKGEVPMVATVSPEFGHLAVPLDGSRMAEAAVPVALALATRLPARVTLLHVIERAAPETVHGDRHLTGVAEAEAYLAEVARRFAVAGIAAEVHAHPNPEGDVAAGIADHAAELGARLVVLCAHGRGGLRGWLSGTVAQPGGVPRPQAAGGQAGDMTSGGIGLSREAWEGIHGPGAPTETAPPPYGTLYGYEDGAFYVAFEGSKSDAADVVMSIEVARGEEGVTYEDTFAVVDGLVPVDAELTEAYPAPPTPGGPVGLNVLRYASASLDEVPHGSGILTPNFLVVVHERVEEINDTGHQRVYAMRVTRVSIMVPSPRARADTFFVG